MKNGYARTAASAAVVGAVAAAVAAVALARPSATHPTLIGIVGKHNAYTIALVNAAGKAVKKLKPGTYRVVIHDDSSIHNYELAGPNGKTWTFTSVPFTGTKTFTLKLTAGKYKAFCAPHASVMFERFTVSR